MPPSQVVSLPPLNGVTPPSGKVMFSAPLSVVKATSVLSSSPMSSSSPARSKATFSRLSTGCRRWLTSPAARRATD